MLLLLDIARVTFCIERQQSDLSLVVRFTRYLMTCYGSNWPVARANLCATMD